MQLDVKLSALGASVQLGLSKTPFGSSEVKLTLPVGLVVSRAPVSVTVTVHVDWALTARMSVGPLPAGTQLTAVEVGCVVTVSIVVPELEVNVTLSPGYEAVIVGVPTSGAV